MSKSRDFFVDPEKLIDSSLVANAAKEVKPKPPLEKDFFQLEWTPACQGVLEAYQKNFYSRIQPGSSEDNIARHGKVKNTSREIFKLPAGKIFGLPEASSSYVAIPLAADGDVTVRVVNESDCEETVPWQIGTMIYLRGTVGLRCSSQNGEGSVICIMLALNHED